MQRPRYLSTKLNNFDDWQADTIELRNPMPQWSLSGALESLSDFENTALDLD
jgi:hypothetical protein